jgi:hypothetical protein
MQFCPTHMYMSALCACVPSYIMYCIMMMQLQLVIASDNSFMKMIS